VADIPPDLVNPGAVELVLDIRKEYAKKHEEVIPFYYCKWNMVKFSFFVDTHLIVELGLVSLLPKNMFCF